jgi:ligand-binding sensor domain-containing protein/signal transduction histidine kinase/ActR/RegA family two-component response regulator
MTFNARHPPPGEQAQPLAVPELAPPRDRRHAAEGERRCWPRIGGATLLVTLALTGGLDRDALALDPDKAPTQYALKVWGESGGLPNAHIQAILRTRDGYLWIGTEEGVARFDGVRFQVFDHRSTPGFACNSVGSLLETRDGTLWAGSRCGLSRYKDGRWLPALTTADGLPSGYILSLRQSRGGGIWIGTASGLARLHDGRVEALTSATGVRDRANYILEDPDGTLWIATGQGLVCRSALRVITYTHADGLAGDDVMWLARGPEGALWIATTTGLSRFKDGVFTNYGREHGLGDVRALAWDRAGSLWIAGDFGLSRLHDGRFAALTTSGGLPSDTAEVVYEDRDGILWVGTNGGGLVRLADTKFTIYTTREGLTADMTWSATEDRDGTMWIATERGVNALHRDGRVVRYGAAEGLSSDGVLTVSAGRDGAVWVGTRLGCDRLQNGRFVHYGPQQGLSGTGVRAVDEARDGTVWIATTGGGLDHLAGGRFTTYTTAEGLSNNNINAVRQTRDGSVWVGTRGSGLNRLKDGSITVYTKRDGLPEDEILALMEDDESTLWIGTTQGLGRFRNGRLTKYTPKEGLYDELILSILDDRAGSLWIGTNHGIFRILKKQIDELDAGRRTRLVSTAYTTADGLRRNECGGVMQNAAWRARDGRLWFPTYGGVAVVDPTQLREGGAPAPVLVEEVRVDKQLISGVGQPPGRGELEFRYTALDLLHPEKIGFRYLLEGFDSEWTSAGSRRTAYYTNIPPGRYRFRVIGSQEGAPATETEAAVEIALAPHFYQARWFQALAAIAAGLLVTGSYRWRVRWLHQRAQDLTLLVEERTAAQGALRDSNRRLEEALEQLRQTQGQIVKQERMRALGNMASGIAHDFNNALAPIIGFSELLLNRPERIADRPLVERYLRLMNTAAQDAANVVRRLRDFYRHREENEPFQVVDLREVARQVITLSRPRWKDQAQAAGLTIAVATRLERVAPVEANESDLREALMNVVFNAVDAMPEGGTLTLLTGRDGDDAVVEVRDTGMGMSDEVRQRCLEPFFTTKGERGTGLGLAMVYGIVKRHKGSLEITSAEGRGTSVLMRFPGAGQAARSTRPAGARPSRHLHILVIDDAPLVREVARTFLEGEGHRVEAIASGRELLAMVDHGDFDVLLLDRAMPGMNGDQLAAKVKSTRPEIPIILLTGFGHFMNASGEKPSGVDVVLPKPFTADSLREALESAVGLPDEPCLSSAPSQGPSPTPPLP